MKTKKYIASKEFVVGKNNIGYISTRFTEEFRKAQFASKPMPTFRKLGKSMTDAQIESELKPGMCELGDVLTFLENAPEECKDGWSNLFYFPSFVVRVVWRDGPWSVSAWDRDGSGWSGYFRVFSPATGNSKPLNSTLDSSEALTLISEIEASLAKLKKLI